MDKYVKEYSYSSSESSTFPGFGRVKSAKSAAFAIVKVSSLVFSEKSKDLFLSAPTHEFV